MKMILVPSKLKRLLVFRDLDLPGFVGRHDLFLHTLDGSGLTVNQKCFPGRTLEGTQPSQDLAIVCMRRKTINDMDLRAYRVILTKNTDQPCAVRNLPSARTLRLEADKHNGVPCVGEALDQMVKNPPARGH